MASAAPASSPRRRRLCFAGQDSGGLARFAAIFPQCNKMASEIETYDDIAEALRCGFRFFGAGGAPPRARRPPLGPRACLICSSTRKPFRMRPRPPPQGHIGQVAVRFLQRSCS